MDECVEFVETESARPSIAAVPLSRPAHTPGRQVRGAKNNNNNSAGTRRDYTCIEKLAAAAASSSSLSELFKFASIQQMRKQQQQRGHKPTCLRFNSFHTHRPVSHLAALLVLFAGCESDSDRSHSHDTTCSARDYSALCKCLRLNINFTKSKKKKKKPVEGGDGKKGLEINDFRLTSSQPRPQPTGQSNQASATLLLLLSGSLNWMRLHEIRAK